MEDEHVGITAIYEKFPPKFKVFATVFNFLTMIVVDIAMIKYGFKYVEKFGNQLSMGMSIPMKYMYGIIPLGCSLALIALIVKLVEYLMTLKKGSN